MPTGNETFLSDIRAALGALTEADPYFINIPVVTERLKDLQGRIDQIVGRTNGIMLILVTPVVGGVLANVPGANFAGIEIVGRVLENTKINETGKEALDVAIYTHALWSQLKPDALASALVPQEPPIVLGNDPKYLSYDIRFQTEGGMKIDVPQLEPITSAVVSGQYELYPAGTWPQGTNIWVTENGTKPFPRNPDAIVYQTPLSFNPGTTFRSRAWLPGYLPSAELRSVLP